jgi:hypothetical protein
MVVLSLIWINANNCKDLLIALVPGATLTLIGMADVPTGRAIVLLFVLGLTLTLMPVELPGVGRIGLMAELLFNGGIGFLFAFGSPSFLIVIMLLLLRKLLDDMLLVIDPLLLDLSFFGDGIDLR